MLNELRLRPGSCVACTFVIETSCALRPNVSNLALCTFRTDPDRLPERRLRHRLRRRARPQERELRFGDGVIAEPPLAHRRLLRLPELLNLRRTMYWRSLRRCGIASLLYTLCHRWLMNSSNVHRLAGSF